jgi:hypothetical protein
VLVPFLDWDTTHHAASKTEELRIFWSRAAS